MDEEVEKFGCQLRVQRLRKVLTAKADKISSTIMDSGRSQAE